jgi:hypothetical protein
MVGARSTHGIDLRSFGTRTRRKKTIRRSKHRGNDIRTDLEENRIRERTENSVTQNRKQRKAFVDPCDVGNYRLAKQLLASQEELCSME